jgi:hypothetical protein
MADVDVYSKTKSDELLAAKRVRTGEDIQITGETDLETKFVEKITVVDDLVTPSANWVDRLVTFFKPSAVLASRMVMWLNEYTELRLAPAKHNTTAFRVFVRDSSTVQPTARDADVPLIEMMDDRVNRNPIWGLYYQGEIRVNEVPMNYAMVLGPLDPIPTGTPANTIIVRTT